MDTKIIYDRHKKMDVSDDLFKQVDKGIKKITNEIYIDSIIQMYMNDGLIDKSKLSNIR